ncbi:MAG: ABC transporter permease [Bacteroidales bacterium]|nr:ABC transporter permease [Bacteroidales bacterium]MDD4684772.1 ABC transporter permease [Bacteroidales bacterium]
MEKGIIPVLKRELKKMVSRPIYIMMTVFIPLIIILFFSTFLNKGMPSDLPIAMVDLDSSSTSRQITRNIEAGQTCEIKYKLSSFEEAKDKMQRENIYAFVLIPKNFQADLLSGKNPQIVFYTEYAHYLAGSATMKELNTILVTLSSGINLKMRLAKGEESAKAMANVQPIKLDSHLIGNPLMNYSYYLSSIIMPGLIFLMSLISCIYTIGVELKFETSRHWLITAGGSMPKALLGKLLPYTFIYSIMLVFSYFIMNSVLGFPTKGNVFLMLTGGILTIISYQAIGIFIVGVLPMLRDALSIGAFYGVLGFTISGFTYPSFAMLPAVKPYTFLYPLTQYYNLYSNIQVNGLTLSESYMPFLLLIAYCLIPILVMSRLRAALIKLNFKRE